MTLLLTLPPELVFCKNLLPFSFYLARWFWKAVRKFSQEQKSKLLRFVTSVGRPPLGGFKELNPPFTIRLINFQVSENTSVWSSFLLNVGIATSNIGGILPTASSCFNLLKLPNYPNYDMLYEKLSLAIENDTGFGTS